ncbi:MAG: RidA family protein [Vicinamibacterales bacterium]
MTRTILAVTAALAVSGVAMQGQGKQVTVPGGGSLPFSLAVKADGLIYVAGTLSQKGDIKAQTKGVLDSIGQTLEKSGSSLANVVAAHVYLTNAADAAGMTEVWRGVWPKDAPTRTTVVAKLVSPSALIEISVVAVPTGAERVVVTPQGWSTANPYSYAIRTGDTLFMSGVVSRNTSSNEPIDGDFATQTKQVMTTAGELLKAAGFGFEHVVSSRVYINDVAGFQDMNRNYTPSFPKEPPARATVVTGLPGPTYKVEMTFIAHRGAKQAFTTPGPDGSPGRASATLSSAIKAGNRLYLSGILGSTAETKGDMKGQAAESLARIGRTLTAAGYSWSDVVDSLVYITDISQFNAMNEAYREAFGKDFPARATVGTGLVGGDGLVEIMLTASK